MAQQQFDFHKQSRERKWDRAVIVVATLLPASRQINVISAHVCVGAASASVVGRGGEVAPRLVVLHTLRQEFLVGVVECVVEDLHDIPGVGGKKLHLLKSR